MSQDMELACRCGAVHGWVRNVSPRTVNRAVCYCADCQAFLHHLGRADLLDAQGGTDIVQVAPADLSFDRGLDRIVGLRLTARGIHRWYASCCKTPLGNTRSPSLPFVGMLSQVLAGALDGPRRDQAFGKSLGVAFPQHAIGGPPAGSSKSQLRLIGRTLSRVLGWKLGGKTWPHPFFDRATGAPRFPVSTLAADEREALRARCGPSPTVSATPG